MNIIYFLVIALFLFFIGLFIASQIVRVNHEEAERLDNLIDAKRSELAKLEKEIQAKTLDRTTALNKPSLNVLNMYDKTGIKIPIDIIEELGYLNLSNEQDVLAYIENQRQFWKLECTKKPFKQFDEII